MTLLRHSSDGGAARSLGLFALPAPRSLAVLASSPEMAESRPLCPDHLPSLVLVAKFLARCSQWERAGRARRCRGAISEHQKGLETRQEPPGTAGVHHAEGEHHGPPPRVHAGLALLQLKPVGGATPASSAAAKCSLPPPGAPGVPRASCSTRPLLHAAIFL